jgi:hypothetical protein
MPLRRALEARVWVFLIIHLHHRIGVMDYQALIDVIRSPSSEMRFTAIIGLVLLLLHSLLTSGIRRKRSASSKLDLIPSPKGRDHTSLFLGPMRHSWLLQQSNELGPVFTVTLKGQKHVITTDPLSASKVLGLLPPASKSSAAPKAQAPWPKLQSLCSSYSEIFHYRSEPGLSTFIHCDERWRASRKCLAHAFSSQELNQVKSSSSPSHHQDMNQ